MVVRLHLPTVSPSVFATVTSPSNEETVNGQFWSIEQQAELYPTDISDDSPLKQSILYRNYRHDSDSKAQEQIELYFSNYHDVTSPPDLPPTGPLLVENSPEAASLNASYVQPSEASGGKSSKWTQTCITLPSVLPAPVEAVLRQYNFITDVQEEPNNLSNSTLRRKLFNVDMFSDEDAEDDPHHSTSSSSSSSSELDDPLLSPLDDIITTGKLLHTPVTSRVGGGGEVERCDAQWSSSPMRGRLRTSFSSPDLHSPMFSPIAAKEKSEGDCRDKVTARVASPRVDWSCAEEQGSIVNELSAVWEEKEGDENNDDSVGVDHGETETDTERETTGTEKDNSDLYKTAEIKDLSCANMDIDSNSGAAWRLTHQSMVEDSSTAAWGLTLPTQGEEDSNMNTESRIDTGYTTNTVSSLQPSGLQDSAQPSLVDMDSGVSTSQPPDLTVSLILPAVHRTISQPLAVAPNQMAAVQMSYAAECTNDISVGFPLGSSTPTK